MNGAARDDEWRGLLATPPGASRARREPGEFGRRVLRLMREPFTAQARNERVYAAAGLLLAIPGFVFVSLAVTVGLGLSLSFAGMLVGLPLLVVSLAGARQLGVVCRGLTGRLLNVKVASPPPVNRLPGVIGWVRSGITDQAGWRACGYLLLKLPVAAVGAAVASFLVFYGLPYVTFPIWWEILHVLASHGYVIHLGPWISWWRWDPILVAYSVHSLLASFALVPLGAIVILAAPWTTRAANAVDAALVKALLGPPLPQRVRQLEQTRARAVDDAAARLRQIERDLHDGAQAQMVAVAMKLGLAREKLAARPAAGTTEADLERALELVDAAHASAKAAIVELRDLARGIHPPVLDHGLGTALGTLAATSGVPVELVTDLPQRPSAAIETIAYFCAAELLANAVKHSGARHVTLEAVAVLGSLRVRVTDDGSGGARQAERGGLAGLADRLKTVDGTIDISSPPGGPTVVTVQMPSKA